MAWRNCQQAITATIPQLMLTDANADAFMQALIAAGSSSQAKTAAYNTYIKPLLLNTYCQSTALINEKIVGDSSNYINCVIESGFANFYFYYHNTQLIVPLLTESRQNNWVCAYVALVDDENNLGYWQGFQLLITNPLNTSAFAGTQPQLSGESANQVYTILTSNEYHQYTWSTVSSISGKNGTLSLTKILNINDGEPVQDITNKGNLDFSKKTKVNTLVTNSFVPEHREDATKALAKYEVQNKVYSYCTLVYKKGEIPNDVTDGTAIQIDPDGDEVAITGLEENKTYYFVIFTNKTTSEPYRFRTGKNEAPEGIFKTVYIITSAVRDGGFEETITVSRV